ncbi:hypothetical protein R1sor_024407 [Riccia sorocarpa]|uniref:Uncharacterized protein n=1 Tax=Riccia sorocarpa TaxID=122646 RepID=A0ABD3GSA5_9MARC
MMKLSLDTAAEMLKDKRMLANDDDVSHISFRILRGAVDKDFETMTDMRRDRRIIQIAPLQGANMFGKSGYEMLLQIGYGVSDIECYLKHGWHFRMVIFELTRSPAKRATWGNVMEALYKAYSLEVENLKDHEKLANAMSKVSFEDFERLRTADWEQNLERLPHPSVDVSGNELHSLFKGDGYTWTADGKQGVEEFVMQNVPLSALDSYRLFDLQVTVP